MQNNYALDGGQLKGRTLIKYSQILKMYFNVWSHSHAGLTGPGPVFLTSSSSNQEEGGMRIVS